MVATKSSKNNSYLLSLSCRVQNIKYISQDPLGDHCQDGWAGSLFPYAVSFAVSIPTVRGQAGLVTTSLCFLVRRLDPHCAGPGGLGHYFPVLSRLPSRSPLCWARRAGSLHPCAVWFAVSIPTVPCQAGWVTTSLCCLVRRLDPHCA